MRPLRLVLATLALTTTALLAPVPEAQCQGNNCAGSFCFVGGGGCASPCFCTPTGDGRNGRCVR